MSQLACECVRVTRLQLISDTLALRVALWVLYPALRYSTSLLSFFYCMFFFFFQAEDGIRDWSVTGVQTCALPICSISPSTGNRSGTRSRIPAAETSRIGQ